MLPRPRRRSLAAAACAALAVGAWTGPARATDVELQAAGGGTTYLSTWRGDYGAGGTLRAGARFAHLVAADFQVWESMATVNERVNTGLSLGVTGTLPLDAVRPYARLFALHQHEEGLVSVVATPMGYLFGIGSGIRHRAGGGLTLGAELPLGPPDQRPAWLLFAEVTATYFPDATLGPSLYVGLAAGIGLDWLLR